MQILDQEIPLKENLRFSLKRYKVWWIILLMTMIFDFLTTLYFVDKYGVASEGNSLVSGLILTLGLVAGVFVGKLLQLFSVTAFVSLHQKLGNVFLLVVVLFNFWAVVVNVI
jgi:hypothetical protein